MCERTDERGAMTSDPNVTMDAAAFLQANERWVAGFDRGALEVRPARRMAVLTCMDSRYTAQGVLGLDLGDAHILRNAGGRATDDMLRSLVLSAHVLGTRGCVVVHHTNCGLYQTTNEDLRARVAAATGADAGSIDFLPFDDLEESVREDVARIRGHALLPDGYGVLGFVYDVRTGGITQVK
jgi:carbonic anhydrase